MEYIKSDKTGVHVIDPIDCERTLCGDVICDQMDEDIQEAGRFTRLTGRRRLSCVKCIRIVRYCRSRDG